MFEKRPHFKWAKPHKKDCKCLACRIWGENQRNAQLLEKLDQAENAGNQSS